jgi:exodeoxyribonuclease V gamma subunit
MGVKLYFSNQLLPLAQRLQQNLLPADNPPHGLDAPVVIVPNMNLAKWIKLTLSRRSDVFMNVAFDYLEDGLWQMIDALTPPMHPEVERLDRESLKMVLFFILMALDEEDQTVEPINRYLRQSDGKLRADREMRCWQLAEELSRLFQEYEYHRSDMIQRWRDGHPADDAMQACQQWLYQRMQSLANRLGPVLGRMPLTMAEYARRLPAPSGLAGAPHGPHDPRVHFFGLSQISPFHIELLSRLQTGYDIHIYSLNPSREYWEDVKTPVEKKWIARKNVDALKFSEQERAAGDLFSPVDHELLSAWGKPGRENIRLLCQLTDYDFDAGFADMPQPDTVLSAVQQGILTLAPAADPQRAAWPQDTSLQIMACPGIRREVETVYQSILYNLANHSDLWLTDIAVMVSDMSRYKPVVDSVFSQSPARITYNLVDACARTESLFAQAVMSLMALARGSFSRKTVFAFLRNPCVQQRWSFSPETLSIWIEWADALGIFHGYENPHDAHATMPQAGLFSWRQGLERLRLSRIMTPPARAAGDPRAHFGGLVPFADINTGDHRLLEKFSTLIPALHAAVAQLKTGTKTALTWRDTFFQVVDQFIEIAPDMRGEETVFQSLLTAFDHFIRYDALMQVHPGQMLSVEALWAFVGSHLEGITGGQGDYLTGGVTVSALMPMRPIPFKIVYVLGLEEGRFPGRANDSLLDLRIRQRRIGDVSLAERNRYLFLEILISVHDKLYLSYVSRDLQKDRDLEPCSVILQLRRHVEQHVLGGRAFKIQPIPIKADSPRYLAADAVTAWSDAMVNTNLMPRISSYRRSGLWNEASAQLTPAEQAMIARYEPDFSLPAASPTIDAASTISLTIGLLRRFLLDPVAVAGRYHLGAYEPADPVAELAEIEDEPLASRFPVDFEIRTTAVQNWLVTGVNPAGAEPTLDMLAVEFDMVYKDLTRRSKVPAGAFADPDRSRLQGDVLSCGATLLPHIFAMRSARQLFSAVVLGSVLDDGIDTGGIQLNLNPLELTVFDGGGAGSPATVQLSGGLPWVWQAEDTSWHCLVVTGSGLKSKTPDKYILAPRLVLMAIAASNASVPWAGAGSITVHVGYREHGQHHRYTLDPVHCREYLQALIEDFLTPRPLIWLPFATVFGTRSLLGGVKQGEVSDIDRQGFAGSMNAAMQAALDPVTELYGATVPGNILDLARRRFGVFLPAP